MTQYPYEQPSDDTPTPPQGFPAPQTFQPPEPPRPPNRRRGLIIAAIVAVIALAAGTVVTVMAFNRSDSVAGAASPREATEQILNAFTKGDLSGAAATLAPAEAALVGDLLKDAVDNLKRLEVLKPEANTQNVSGVQLETKNLTFDEANAERINDRLTVTKLTGGTITIHEDASKIPLTDRFLDILFPRGRDTKPSTRTVDIAEEIKREGRPIRIATVKHEDKWYPSLFYTIADEMLREAKEKWPSAPIPANGAASPGDAVRDLVQAAGAEDGRRLIELLPPDEMGVLHDTGPLLLDSVLGKSRPQQVRIHKFDTETQQVTGGTKVLPKEIDIEVGSDRFTLRKDGDCFDTSENGERERMCGSEVAGELEKEFGEKMPPGVRQAFTNIFSGVFKNGLGVVTTQVDGKWYVSPFRTFGGFAITILQSITPQDLKVIIDGE
ncbi:hypothetical protein EV193_102239 [Herbihabitans rhizosphaerae]|uniref:Uncharacterized protein n=1 Tax=Herbihabitans rhizosphaerae TaxID=1872711 RepID=A0A4Q7L3F2_9PSEU|nr:flagellar basal body protein FliL [Herbihabitans rhizosphaerae]RZS43260.1 hypothetical protein EV193_102239 [Herbihabitans rhizosphaerae]